MTEAELNLQRYLRALATQQPAPAFPPAWRIRGPFDLLKQHGRFWTPRPLPSDVRPGVRSLCFHNAYTLARQRPELRYVEGYATGFIIVHHAWCVNDADEVVDPTWCRSLTPLGAAYYGVAVPLAIVARARRTEGTVLWAGGNEVYTHGLEGRQRRAVRS